ncbi:DUF4388 domain-containing protein [bacterium]|nr:DUF4388 domain-containing protein [bacterium]QQR59821.1 MAG: DUF4388 domain-containing protein [Candidatus Melainabacteria bacterium]
MFGSKGPKPSPPRTGGKTPGITRLPQVWGIPELDVVNGMLQLAKKDSGKTIEQTWSVEGVDKLFILTVTSDETGDPEWVMSQSEITTNKLMWAHRTIDTGLIHSIIMAESTGVIAGAQEGGNDSLSSINLGGFTGEHPIPEQEQKPKEIRSTLGSAPPPPPMPQGALQPPGAQPQTQSAQPPSGKLEGSIADNPLHKVLEKIMHEKLSGRLAVRGSEASGDVYTQNGEPIHATNGSGSGDKVLVDLLTVRSGKFRFVKDEKSPSPTNTTTRRIESLIVEVSSINDQIHYLEARGLTDTAFLLSPNSRASDADFHAHPDLSSGVPIDPNLQLAVFRAIGPGKKLGELLKAKPFRRAEWIPIIFNLVSANLLQITAEPLRSEKSEKLEAVTPVDTGLDFSTMKGCMQPVQDQNLAAGVYDGQVFIYFIALEFYRFNQFHSPFSVACFCLKAVTEPQQLSLDELRRALSIVQSKLRPVDMIGQVNNKTFGLLLPNADTNEANALLKEIQAALGNSMYEHFGLISTPETPGSMTMQELLNGAMQCHKRAEMSYSNLVCHETANKT